MSGESGQASSQQELTETGPASFSTYPANRAAQNPTKPGAPDTDSTPNLTALADALDAIPEADRPAVVAHVRALARMSEARRKAVLTLTRET